MRVFLADLGHNILTRSSDTYPLGVADLAAYAQAHLEDVEFRLFREPQDLKKALDAEAPDVLGLSNYSWNQELTRHFAAYGKARHPNTLTCIGGPNFPLTADEQAKFARRIPEVDVIVDGPTYEGERAFLSLLERFAAGGRRIEAVREAPIPGNLWIDPASGEMVHGGDVERIRDLDEIPSPYRSGLLDDFYATGYFPILQVARGCPFRCAFCESGVVSNSKVFAHSIENVKADLLHLAERVKPEITLCFADDNFGMYERDEEIADYLAYLQDRFGWPRYIRTTTGKNKVDRIIRVMRKVRGAMPMTAAVQSMNPVVLKNIQRSNIKLETYTAIQKDLQEQGMQSYGELILCLPGETLESFMVAVEDLLSAGAKRVSAHQLMLLPGAELGTPESRERFGFETRFRLVARNIGDYTGTPVTEVEEMVVSTPTFSYDEYLQARVFHLLLTIFYYEGNYEEAFSLADEAGVRPFDVVVAMQKALDDAPAKLRELIADYVRENEEELFDTREECHAWAREHYDELVDGTLGGNLLSKYSMLGRFYLASESLAFLRRVVGTVLREKGTLEDDQLDSVMGYLDCVILHCPFAEAMATARTWRTSFDVEAWVRDGYERRLDSYRFAKPRSFRASVPSDRRKWIEAKLEMFGEHPSGLGKFTRSMFARDLRRTLDEVAAPVPGSVDG